MATPAHCLTCFEVLDAHLNHREPLSLSEVESSYALYQSSLSESESESTSRASKSLHLDRLAAAAAAVDTADSSSSSSSTTSPAWSSSATPATSTSSLSLSTISAPLFVTWNTVGGEDDDDDDDDDNVSLRGCIGTFESQPLSIGIPEYAIISALHDTRFDPISKKDMPQLQSAVTLLTDFEETDDAYDWEIGTHGIRLSFTDRGHRYGATYLPNVAAEQGWTKDETLYSLIRKAGWIGGRSKWKTLELKVTRYRGRKASLNYPEFKKWRDWLASRQS
ncbi:hypothetical protein E4U21_002732 [Claviceps maximensis]|nr:hypothetical protein E4U21_002732 [Claviceps maximensis]